MLQYIDCVILIFVIDVIFVVEIILDRLKDAAKATFELSPGGVAKRQDAITTTEVVMAAAISPLSFISPLFPPFLPPPSRSVVSLHVAGPLSIQIKLLHSSHVR